MANNEWLDSMLGNKIEKEAIQSQGTDKQDHFERKVVAYPWVNDVLDLDPVKIEAEYQEKLKQEAMTLGKTAAYDMDETPKETIDKDLKRDVKILSDYALAEMLAEARGHEKQSTSEMFSELKEKAKAEVASSREKAENALLEFIQDPTLLDWKKAFEKFTKDAKSTEPSDKDLFKSDVPEKAHDFEHPAEDKFKLPKDAEKAIPGNGREADERTDVTAEAGVLQKDIVEGTSKEASLKVEALYPSDFERDPESKRQFVVFKRDVKVGKMGKITILGSVANYKRDYNNPNDAGYWSGYVTTTSYSANEHSNIGSTGAILWSSENFDTKEEAIAAVKEWEAIELDNTQATASLKTAAAEKDADDKVTHKKATPETPSSGAPMDDDVIREAFRQAVNGAGEDIMLDMLMRYMPVEEMKGMLDDFSDEGEFTPDVEHYEHAGVPTAVSHLKTYVLNKKAMGCPVCGQAGKDMKTSAKENVACESCGITYAKASQEIKSHASKTEVIKKVAELQKKAEVPSSWAVITDENGQEVLARVNQPTNVKESEETKQEEILK